MGLQETFVSVEHISTSQFVLRIVQGPTVGIAQKARRLLLLAVDLYTTGELMVAGLVRARWLGPWLSEKM
jgi:hypothetical protein